MFFFFFFLIFSNSIYRLGANIEQMNVLEIINVMKKAKQEDMIQVPTATVVSIFTPLPDPITDTE